MAELKQHYVSLGFKDVRTYLQSGNVVFGHSRVEESALAWQIENALRKKLKLDISVIIRTANDLHKLIEGNPFSDRDETKLHVTFLSLRPELIPTEQINKFAAKGEGFAIAGGDIYLYCPNGYGRSKLSNTFFERVMQSPATTRHWKTVNALALMSKISK